MITAILFYIFAAILLVSAAMVVSSRNPVHSVLFLILAFFNAAALFLIAGAEFLAMILVIVYVGAVAVLFLFVVMMLDVDFAEFRSGYQRYLPVGATVGAVLFIELAIVLGGWKLAPSAVQLRMSPVPSGVSNTEAIGRVLYTDYVFLFQTAGLILLVAMIGAIVLTLRDRKTSRHQDIRRQTERTVVETLQMMSVSLGAGTNQSGGYLRPKEPEPEPVEEPVDAEATAMGISPACLPRKRGKPMMDVGLGHFLVVSAILLVLGIFGIFLNRKNVIVILMSIELILLAVNLNFVAFSAAHNDLAGQVMAMLVLTVAAAEAAIGLAIVVIYFRNRGSIQVEDVNLMKG